MLPADALGRIIRVLGDHRRDDSKRPPIPLRDCTCGVRVFGPRGADEHVAGMIIDALGGGS